MILICDKHWAIAVMTGTDGVLFFPRCDRIVGIAHRNIWGILYPAEYSYPRTGTPRIGSPWIMAISII